MSGPTLLVGDCVDVMATLEPESVDAIATDPPYGLEFMGKEWDKLALPRPGNLGGFATGDKPSFARVRKHLGAMLDWHCDWATAALRVAKPGAHLVAFGGTRTHHYLMLGLELAGWEIRDCLMWLYGSGFPKSRNLKGDWRGWGTALKPGWEPIVLARKPLIGTVVENVEEHGTGALNIDGCRIEGPRGNGVWGSSNATVDRDRKFNASPGDARYRSSQHPAGRWPTNVVLDEEAAAEVDAHSGELTSGAGNIKRSSAMGYRGNALGSESRPAGTPMVSYGDSGGASRFFYCAKASRAEREAGLEGLPARPAGMVNDSGRSFGQLCDRCGGQIAGAARSTCDCADPLVRYKRPIRANHHPTVKPVTLMCWLVRLVTRAGGLVLDPFAGSGTTGIACVLEGFRFLGIEQEPEYLAIAQARIAHVEQQPSLWREAAP